MTGGAKVVALPGTKLDDGSVPANVVALIEEVLAEARAGRVAAVAIAYVTPQHVIHRCRANAGFLTAHDMVAACCYLLDDVKKE